MLSGEAAEGVAEAYALGTGAVLEGPVARGQLGRVWRLRTDDADFAVKEWYAGPDPAVPESDALLSERARAAGVFTPRVVRSRAGQVVATVGAVVLGGHLGRTVAGAARRLHPGACAVRRGAGGCSMTSSRWSRC